MTISVNNVVKLLLVGAFFTTLGSLVTMHGVKKRLQEQEYEAYWSVVCKDVKNTPFFFEDLHVTFIDQDGTNVTIDGYTDTGKDIKVRAEGWCILSKPRSLQ